MRRQHKAPSTESSYTFWLRRYMSAVRQYPETLTSEQKLERFLSDLVQHRDVSASSQNQAFNAILFFYRDVLGNPFKESTRCGPPGPPGCAMRPTPGIHAKDTVAGLRQEHGLPAAGNPPPTSSRLGIALGQQLGNAPLQIKAGVGVPQIPSRIPMNRHLRRYLPAAQTEETVAIFGEARLVCLPNGRLEVAGGNADERQRAHEWTAQFLRPPDQANRISPALDKHPTIHHR